MRMMYKYMNLYLKAYQTPPDLEGMDEDRLFELQRNVQEQMHKRDKERERNMTKRVREFEKTFILEILCKSLSYADILSMYYQLCAVLTGVSPIMALCICLCAL